MGRPGICTSQGAREGGPGGKDELPSGHLSRKALQKEQNLNQGKGTRGAEAFAEWGWGRGSGMQRLPVATPPHHSPGRCPSRLPSAFTCCPCSQ